MVLAMKYSIEQWGHRAVISHSDNTVDDGTSDEILYRAMGSQSSYISFW